LEQATLLSQLLGRGQLLMLVLGLLQALLRGQRLVLGLLQVRGRLGNLHSGVRTLSTGVWDGDSSVEERSDWLLALG
jgi:hypothetical protein